MTTISTVSVPTGGVVTNSGVPAISVAIPGTTIGNEASVLVAGTVDGAGNPGIAVTTGAAGYYNYGPNVVVTVGQGGTVSGSTAITAGNMSGTNLGFAQVALDNSGTITGTAGAALATGDHGAFSSIINRTGGLIGGISGAVGTIQNQGTIDGSSSSAIAGGTYSPLIYLSSSLTNSGSIVSSGSGATVSNYTGPITNSGTIANSGTGSAITGNYGPITNNAGGLITANVGDTISLTGYLSIDNAGTIENTGAGRAIVGSGGIVNRAGGTISAAGTAIEGTSGVSLTNYGSVVGDILAGTVLGSSYSSIDSTMGSIDGNVIFGTGNDTLFATYSDAGGLSTGITGLIDGGAGTDTLQAKFAADAALSKTIVIPTNFEALAIQMNSGVTVTLSNGFSAPGTLQFAGGTLVNSTQLDGNGIVVKSYTSAAFRNEGSVTGLAVPDQYTVDISGGSFTNNGTISSQGNAVRTSVYTFTNSGTIIAVGTAVNAFDLGRFDNSGTIRSTAGTGLELFGSVYSLDYAATNSGTIEGTQAGVNLSTGLINTGSITSDTIGVALGSYGLLYNKAGGVVSGGTQAINGTSQWLFNSTVINEGTINGDVSIAGNLPYNPSNNIYYALAGGVLNGNLTLGWGDTLVADLQNSGTSQFAGINGTVTASRSHLRYMVSQDASITAGGISGFSNVGYDLYDGATLTLNDDEVQTGTMTFAGNGNALLDVDFNVVAQPAIQRGWLLTPFAVSGGQDGVSITSKGKITLSNVGPYTIYGAAVSLGSADTFTNEGSITVTNTSDSNGYALSAISGGTVTNSGTITVTGGNGVNFAKSLTNNGTITVSGVAAINTQNTITNSGTLASTGGAAIATSYYSYYSIAVDNQAEGTISGNGTAIRLSGGTVINAGAIQGTVDLGYTPYYGRSYSSGVYVASGGTLTGDLLFGSGEDVLVETGSDYGVTGTIDAGDGFDYIGHERSQDATVTLGEALPASFEGEFVSSRSRDTVLTVTADGILDTDILVAGDGQIVNEVSTHGSVTGLGYPLSTLPYFDVTLASFTNKAQIDGQIRLDVSSLSNSGTVGSADLSDSAVYQTATGALSFNNSGTLQSANSGWAFTADVGGQDLVSATIVNSGTVKGNGLGIGLSFDDQASPAKASLNNSGTISGFYGVYAETAAASQNGAAALSFDITNSGMIEATAVAGVALSSTASGTAAVSITNSGTIRANGDGSVGYYYFWTGPCYYDFWSCYQLRSYTASAIAIGSYVGDQVTDSSVATTITNEATGRIEATGQISTAIRTDGPLTLVNAGTIIGSGYTVEATDISVDIFGTTRFAGAIQTFGTGEDGIVNSGSITGSIDLDGGNDSIVNTGTITGDVLLGDGDDRFVERLSATLTGTVDGGDGGDTLVTDLTGGGTLDAAYYDKFTQFENFGLTGNGSLSPNGVLPVQTLMLEAGTTFELAAGSTLQTLGTTALTAIDGTTHVINRGTIVGNVALGSDADVFEVYAGSSVSGTIHGGTGSDRLAFHLDPAATSRTPIDLNPYTGFEQLALESGIGSLSSEASFDTIWVEGGRLIGLVGSTITAPNGITVASGATFGSAGSVNGNIVVKGTLSPGASPETMTVNGNVTLAAGSATLFEMTPTISDALIINGSLTIASGTTLNVVGERPLTPGIRYHLITTTDGITGSFSTINKVTTVHGFITQTADSLDLLGALELHAGAGKPVTATTAYLNGLLIDGAASDQLVAALPQLTAADGYVNAAKMATLHPEAYAVASQIGIDNGFAISSALRSAQRMGDGGSSFFTLGQSFGSWQDLRGSAAAGTADTRQSSGGFLGGVGYQASKLAVSVFLGRIYADQSMPTLGAATKANGTFAGVSVSFAQGGLDLGGSVIWDGSSATTHRTLFKGSTVTGRYDLHGLTFDAHWGYGFSLGKGGWRLGPELGLTHIRVKRDQARESGDALFALDVAGRKQNVTFLSADVRLDMAPSARMRPWLTMGWRHRLGSNAPLAAASLTGVSEQFTVAGAKPDRTYAQVGGGFDWIVTSGVTLFARGSSAFTNAHGVTNVNGGIRLGF